MASQHVRFESAISKVWMCWSGFGGVSLMRSKRPHANLAIVLHCLGSVGSKASGQIGDNDWAFAVPAVVQLQIEVLMIRKY